MQSFAAAQQIVAELLRYAACLGEMGGGDLEVGQGFQKTSTAPRQQLLSYPGSVPRDNCFSGQDRSEKKSCPVRMHRLTEAGGILMFRVAQKRLRAELGVLNMSEHISDS